MRHKNQGYEKNVENRGKKSLKKWDRSSKLQVKIPNSDILSTKFTDLKFKIWNKKSKSSD